MIWSPFINKPSRVNNGLMHISDWLPTLISAAGLLLITAYIHKIIIFYWYYFLITRLLVAWKSHLVQLKTYLTIQQQNIGSEFYVYIMSYFPFYDIKPQIAWESIDPSICPWYITPHFTLDGGFIMNLI